MIRYSVNIDSYEICLLCLFWKNFFLIEAEWFFLGRRFDSSLRRRGKRVHKVWMKNVCVFSSDWWGNLFDFYWGNTFWIYDICCDFFEWFLSVHITTIKKNGKSNNDNDDCGEFENKFLSKFTHHPEISRIDRQTNNKRSWRLYATVETSLNTL